MRRRFYGDEILEAFPVVNTVGFVREEQPVNIIDEFNKSNIPNKLCAYTLSNDETDIKTPYSYGKAYFYETVNGIRTVTLYVGSRIPINVTPGSTERFVIYAYSNNSEWSMSDFEKPVWFFSGKLQRFGLARGGSGTYSGLKAVDISKKCYCIGSEGFLNYNSPNTDVIIPDFITEISTNLLWSSVINKLVLPKSIVRYHNYYNYIGLGGSTVNQIVLDTELNDLFNGNTKCQDFIISEENNRYYIDENNILRYKKDDGSNIICRGTKYINTSIIGDSKHILPYAFYNNTSLQGIVTLKNEITDIGDYAFYYCENIKGEFTIPDSVTSIGAYCFNSTINVTSMSVGNGVTEILSGTFGNMSSLVEFKFSNSIKKWSGRPFPNTQKINAVYYEGTLEDWLAIDFSLANSEATPAYRLAYNNGTIYFNNVPYDSWIFPDGITSIGAYSMKGFNAGEDIVLPDTLKSIGYESFAYCVNVKSITIPNSITEIDETSFNLCSRVTNMTLNSNYFYDWGRCFTNLSIITLGENVTDYFLDGNILYYKKDDRFECIKVDRHYSNTELTILDGCKVIHQCACYYLNKITDLTLPSTLEEIKADAFKVCRNITDIYCKATTPPIITSNSAFEYNYIKDSCTLHVPIGSLDAYRGADYWGTSPTGTYYFTNIIDDIEL